MQTKTDSMHSSSVIFLPEDCLQHTMLTNVDWATVDQTFMHIRKICVICFMRIKPLYCLFRDTEDFYRNRKKLRQQGIAKNFPYTHGCYLP